MRYMGRPGHRAGSPLSVPVERRRALAWLLVTGAGSLALPRLVIGGRGAGTKPGLLSSGSPAKALAPSTVIRPRAVDPAWSAEVQPVLACNAGRLDWGSGR